jgi:hypothetical protein
MTRRELKAVAECKAQIELDLMFINKARKEAQDAIDTISSKSQAITTRLTNLEEYLA